MRNESARPGATGLVKSVGDRLVRKDEGDTTRLEGIDFVAFNDCKSV